jgi:DNA-binding NarL/FixJ family response regulator
MSESSHRTRVLIIEHNRILLEGLSHLLAEAADLEIAGAATTGAAGLILFAQKRPDVVVVDLEIPDMTAAYFVQQIQRIDARPRILILATYELDPAGAEAIAFGAAGILAKDQIASALAPLIRSVVSRTP